MGEPAAEFFLEGDEPVRRFRGTSDANRRLRRIERLAWLLDQSIWIGKWRIGLDPILGLIPGVGDAIGTLLSLYVLYEGVQLGTPGPVVMRMTANVLLDAVVGAIPLLGDLFDFGWRANTRNLALVQRHHQPGRPPQSMAWVWAAVAAVAVVVLGVVIGFGYVAMKEIQAFLH